MTRSSSTPRHPVISLADPTQITAAEKEQYSRERGFCCRRDLGKTIAFSYFLLWQDYWKLITAIRLVWDPPDRTIRSVRRDRQNELSRMVREAPTTERPPDRPFPVCNGALDVLDAHGCCCSPRTTFNPCTTPSPSTKGAWAWPCAPRLVPRQPSPRPRSAVQIHQKC